PRIEGGEKTIYDTPNYNRFRRVLGRVIRRKWLVAGIVVGALLLAGLGMSLVKKQFFATSKVEAWLAKQKEAKIVTSYIGQGAPRFYLAMAPELPDPSFAKIVIRA